MLEDLRKNIDRVDKELLNLFLERMEYCKRVGEYKKENNLPVYDPKRELDILEDKIKGIEDKQDRLTALEFFGEIMDISKELQMEIIGKKAPEYSGKVTRVCYCGAQGAFAHEAALSYFGEQEMKNVSRFPQVVEAVLSGECEYGVLPIENSSQGSVLEVYDLLGQNAVYIVGEKYLPVRHCLLGCGTLEEINTVISHPQALRQCSKFIQERDYKIIESTNTAIAARDVAAEGDPGLAAIASKHAGELYGLNLLREDISNSNRNYTRFVIIGRELEHKEDYQKVSLTFALSHREGALLDVLKRFEHLNLTKIESRPKGKWEYLFYLDFEGGRIDDMIESIDNVRILGLYLKGDK